MKHHTTKLFCLSLTIFSTFCFVYLSAKLSPQWYQSKIKPQLALAKQYFTDKLGLTTIAINSIITPQSIEELQNIVQTTTTLPLSIVGAAYSQGGQTGYPDGMVIDMKQLNKIIHFDEKQKTITVQAGATWYDIQKHIDPYNLSVKAMQSYNNFSIGGSLGVNAHGRDITYGSVINGILSIEILLADGTIVTADRTKNNDLFKAAIGGYGLLGIITQATISLTENIPIERKLHSCSIDNFKNIFESMIAQDKSITFYNTDLLPKQYQECFITTWHTTSNPITDKTRLQEPQSPFYIINKSLEMFLRRVPFAFVSRLALEKFKKIKTAISVAWRNNEMSYSVNQLAIDWHFPTTMTLQEYFIPIEHAQTFAKKLTKILKKNWVNVLNVSIRYVPADTTTTLSYAPHNSFAFVLYLNVFNTSWTINRSCAWTQKIINTALKYNGTYYLPYLMCATKEQFMQAYPQFNNFLTIKQTYDPDNKFRNMLLQKYS
jgi:FAD/FMN-containing dehydrogenase